MAVKEFDELKPNIDTTNIADLIRTCNVGRLKRYKKGEVLYHQGEELKCIHYIKKGSVKVFSLSEDGRICIHEILRDDSILGLPAYFSGGEHETTAETLEKTDIYIVPIYEFEHLMANKPSFAQALIREQAHTIRRLRRRVMELSIPDVRKRLQHSLLRLADEHGLMTTKGFEIDLNLTHEELAALLAANRSTITAYINELRRQGYVWVEKRRFVLVPPEHIRILNELKQSVLKFDEKAALQWSRKALEEGVDPLKALEALSMAINQVDNGFGSGALSLADIIGAAFAMKNAMMVIEEQLKQDNIKVLSHGRVVIGTVFGDIHDIGKTMVSMLLIAGGFDVIDLGVNVTSDQFVAAIEQYQPEILAMSALMNVTLPEQIRVINALIEKGLRHKIKIMVGGGCVTQELADLMGADGYESTAQGAVNLAKRLII